MQLPRSELLPDPKQLVEGDGAALHRGHDLALPVLDPFGQIHLPLPVQKRDGTHLLEVEPHRVVRLDPAGVLDLLLFLLGGFLLLRLLPDEHIPACEGNLLERVDDLDRVLPENLHHVIDLIPGENVGGSALFSSS
jgi:hypothetical protein